MNKTLFFALSFFAILSVWFSYLLLFKYRVWVLNQEIFKTNKKSIVKYTIYAYFALLVSIIFAILILNQNIIIGTLIKDKNGLRIDEDNRVYNIWLSIEGMLSIIFVISSLIPVALISFYLFNSRVNAELKPDELEEFSLNTVFKVEEAERSYYILKSSKKRNQAERNVVFSQYISSSLIFLNISKKLFYKSIIKKTISFVLQRPISTPEFTGEKNTKNLVMIFLISSIKILNKSSKHKLELQDIMSHLKGLTF
ncbi:hypothetical protein [Mycoplasmopsis canis]|uniref:hypothetical protein n=1 Tax=Mycoplasmopsis canis TaxID=29555 RepID=UPI00025AFF07|nr:hypothetical protein [Mycoplasmopsis canis]EIE39281.1 hypothetical protein MCANUF33_02730 [Mycoplasmopsis canis UF33]